jgi:hypothetical protein
LASAGDGWTVVAGCAVLGASLLALVGVSRLSNRRILWVAMLVLLLALLAFEVFFPPGVPLVGNPPGR